MSLKDTKKQTSGHMIMPTMFAYKVTNTSADFRFHQFHITLKIKLNIYNTIIQQYR